MLAGWWEVVIWSCGVVKWEFPSSLCPLCGLVHGWRERDVLPLVVRLGMRGEWLLALSAAAAAGGWGWGEAEFTANQ